MRLHLMHVSMYVRGYKPIHVRAWTLNLYTCITIRELMPEKLEPESNTVRLNITVSKELDERFRKAVADSLGFKKGNLQLAIEQAIEEWMEKQEKLGKRK